MSTNSENPEKKLPENTDDEIRLQTGEASVDPNSIEGVFLLALQKQNQPERDAYLDEACGDDVDRRNRVVALLRAYDDSGSFLDTPVGGQRPADETPLDFLEPIEKDGFLGAIGPYEVHDVIGRGGMGIVMRAFDPKLSRVVAIKVLIPELAANVNARRRFLREARAAAAVSHPHVITIHAVEESASNDAEKKSVPPYLVMECVVGQSLQQKLDGVGTLPVDETLRVSRQIAEGLAAAHQQGLIHRDIKPANILLENGVERVKITDFGLARAIDDITVTRTGELSGTPQYMSPEQAGGQRVDHRSDLFSLGCVMYAMCTGHSPFRANSLAHVIKRVTQDTPRPITEQNPEVPDWLAEIIECLLQKDPAQRIQDTRNLVSILDQHLVRFQQAAATESHALINQQVAALKADTALNTQRTEPQLRRRQTKQDSTKAAEKASLLNSLSTADAPDESLHGKVGRYLIYAGLFLVVVPWSLIAAGAMTSDGDPMEFGGSITIPGALLGFVALGLGYVLRYIIDSDQARQRKLRPYVPIVAAAMMTTVGVAFHQMAERQTPSIDAPRQGAQQTRSEVISPVPIEVRPTISIHHPPMDVRKLSINGLGSTTQKVSQTQTNVYLRDEHLGTRIRIHVIAMDGREFTRFGFPVERAKDALTTSEADWDPGNRALVEVIDDAPEFRLAGVNFPAKLLANKTLYLSKPPFHCLLGPAERHKLVLTYLGKNAPAHPESSDYERLEHTLTVTGTEPVKISLKELIESRERRSLPVEQAR